jgi:hypothetical protein
MYAQVIFYFSLCKTNTNGRIPPVTPLTGRVIKHRLMHGPIASNNFPILLLLRMLQFTNRKSRHITTVQSKQHTLPYPQLLRGNGPHGSSWRMLLSSHSARRPKPHRLFCPSFSTAGFRLVTLCLGTMKTCLPKPHVGVLMKTTTISFDVLPANDDNQYVVLTFASRVKSWTRTRFSQKFCWITNLAQWYPLRP